jgi:hypothetical protein
LELGREDGKHEFQLADGENVVRVGGYRLIGGVEEGAVGEGFIFIHRHLKRKSRGGTPLPLEKKIF